MGDEQKNQTDDQKNQSGKVKPETLVLRGAPRRVLRFKRGLLIGTVAFGMVMVFGVMALALKTPAAKLKAYAEESFNTENKPMAEGFSVMPASYDEIVEQPKPKLGPPMAGDLGRPILAAERDYGIDSTGSSFHPSDAENDARAERLRLAQQARQAREASVFFPLSQSRAQSAPSGSHDGSYGSGAMAAADAGRLFLDPDRDQNNQQRKADFMNQPAQRSVYNPYPLQDAVSPFQVMAGSIIAASLITGINSDLPGLVVAQVTENVYDTVSGKYLLIPQGARLIGSYDSVVAFGQSRALLVWQRIVLPDGSSVQIENLPATDASGYAGLADKVDFHTWRLLKGVMLSTLLGVGTEFSFGDRDSDLVRAIEMSTQQSVNRAGQRITEKNLNIQPTITIRQGMPLRVVVHKDLILRPYKG